MRISDWSSDVCSSDLIPSLYDVSDSANWSNKADYGLVYHRPDKAENEGQLAVVKVRMGLPGQCGVATVKFDHRVSRINDRSEEHTSELQSLMRISYAVFCLKKKIDTSYIYRATATR